MGGHRNRRELSNSAGFLPAEKGQRELVFLIRNGNPTYRQRENLLLTKLLNFEESGSPDAVEIMKIKEGEPYESHEFSRMVDFDELVAEADLKEHLSEYSRDLNLT